MSAENNLPSQPELTSGSEETPAPHLAPLVPAEAETWSAAPLDPPARLLTSEEKWPSEWHSICWMSAHGASQNQICRELDYSVSRVSIILNKPQVQEKIEQIRREFLGTESLNKKYAAIAPKAADFLSSVILGRESAKVSERLQASTWMLEKVTGKPKQEGATDGGTTILQLLQALDAVKEVKALAEGLAVIEANDIELSKQPRDLLADWVSANVPGEEK